MNRKLQPVIRVLIVEDSPLMQQLLGHILGQDPSFQIVGTADSADTTLALLEELQPDVVTMDIQIKRANGLDLTRQIMQSTPVPIVVVSASCQSGDTQRALEIIQAGALAALPKPPSVHHPDFARHSATLRQIVKDMSAVKVVKRRAGAQTFSKIPLLNDKGKAAIQYKVLAIGASTGGPPAVLELLAELSPKIPVPVLLVQHIYPGFAAGLVEWIDKKTDLQVKLLNTTTKALPGTVYLCENGFQMGMSSDGTVTIENDSADSRHCPSVSHLFSSLAQSQGAKAIGIILSGMGQDGAEELKQMKDKGALTIAQDQKSSIIYGMPGEAARINAAEYILSPAAAGRLVNQLFGLKKTGGSHATAENEDGQNR